MELSYKGGVRADGVGGVDGRGIGWADEGG